MGLGLTLAGESKHVSFLMCMSTRARVHAHTRTHVHTWEFSAALLRGPVVVHIWSASLQGYENLTLPRCLGLHA